MADFWKILTIIWVGGGILIGLLINGKTIYSWIGAKVLMEAEMMVKTLDLMFVEMTIKRALTLFGSYLGAVFLLGVFLLYPSIEGGIIFGIIFVFAAFKLPRILIQMAHKRRIKRFVMQLIDGLTLMSNAMRSGLNVPQAL